MEARHLFLWHLKCLSVLTVISHFHLHVLGFCCHFKAFEIILAEHHIICCTSLYAFPSPIKFSSNYVVSLNNVWNPASHIVRSLWRHELRMDSPFFKLF